MSFIAMSLLSVLVIAVTSLITYEILRVVWVWLPRLHIAPRLRMLTGAEVLNGLVMIGWTRSRLPI